jgi:hypothetical protein
VPEHPLAQRPGGAALAALPSAGAAAIHVAVAPTHLEEWWAFGAFFLGSGTAQLLWALLVLIRPRRPLLWLGAIGNAAIIALWIVTRTAGTLIGPEPDAPEAIGPLDSLATACELLVVLAAAWLAASPSTPGRDLARRDRRRAPWPRAEPRPVARHEDRIEPLGTTDLVVPNPDEL